MNKDNTPDEIIKFYKDIVTKLSSVSAQVSTYLFKKINDYILDLSTRDLKTNIMCRRIYSGIIKNDNTNQQNMNLCMIHICSYMSENLNEIALYYRKKRVTISDVDKLFILYTKKYHDDTQIEDVKKIVVEKTVDLFDGIEI